jgi:ARC6-like, IMS domain
MLGTVSLEMGNLQPGEVVMGIQALKVTYPAIYQLDKALLDRYEVHAVEFMTRLPVDQQDRTVAENKNTQLNAWPITSSVSGAIEPAVEVSNPVVSPPYIPPMQTTTPIPVVEEQPKYTATASQVHSTTPQPIPSPSPNNNKSALIIGSAIIAGSVVFSTLLMSQNSKRESPMNVTLPGVFSPNSSIPNTSVSKDSGNLNRISQDEALQVVKEWLSAKGSLFAPPYNQQLGESLTVGKALADNIRGPSTDGEAESSLEWLRNRRKYWKYGAQRIDSVKNFVSDDQKAVITVSVYEQRTLYGGSGNLERSTDKNTSTSYSLERSGGRLKISDFK